jgi:hypothetical protein
VAADCGVNHEIDQQKHNFHMLGSRCRSGGVLQRGVRDGDLVGGGVRGGDGSLDRIAQWHWQLAS